MLNKRIIYEYIKRIKKEDIYNYGIKEKIVLTDNEVDLIYDYINNKLDMILDNPEIILDEIKDKLRKEVYLKIQELYLKFKYYF